MMASASVFFSVMSVLVRAAKGIPGLTAYHSTLFRFLVGGLVCGGAWWLRRRTVRIVNWRWLIARGVLGGAAVLIYFYAITEIGLAKGTILSFTYPLWAGVLAPFVLKERLRIGVLAALAFAFAGLYLIIAPEGSLAGTSWPDLIALLGGLLAGISVLAIKRLRETDSSPVIFLSQCVFGLMMIAYPALRDPMDFSPSGWALLLGIGLLAAAGQLLMTYAFKHVGGAEGALLGMLTPVGNVVLGVLVFREALTGRMILGGAVVLAACAYAALPPGKRAAPPSA